MQNAASPLPRGTCPCPGEGRRQDEVSPWPLGTVLAMFPGIKSVRILLHSLSWNQQSSLSWQGRGVKMEVPPWGFKALPLPHEPCPAQARNRSEDESQPLYLGTQSWPSSNGGVRPRPFPIGTARRRYFSGGVSKIRQLCGDHSPRLLATSHPIIPHCREEWYKRP